MEGDQAHTGVLTIIRKSIVLDNDNTIYEDDGFFSDVPGSGSLTKSLKAMNKYVKKNLLYDQTEDYEEDKAYFTKENSPNESISKYDSDSVRSNESIDKHVPVSENDKTSTSANATVNFPEVEVANTATLTDDYKINSLLLLERPKSVVPDSANPRAKESRPVSLANLTIIDENETDLHNAQEVVLRERSGDGKNEEKRHTVHDFSDWANRTNIYPDVYAPLPYSKSARVEQFYELV